MITEAGEGEALGVFMLHSVSLPQKYKNIVRKYFLLYKKMWSKVRGQLKKADIRILEAKMRKVVCILAGVMLLGNVFSAASLADETDQNVQLIGPGGQQNNTVQSGGGPEGGQSAVPSVPDQSASEQNQAQQGSGQNAEGPVAEADTSGSGSSQAFGDPGSGQASAGPGNGQTFGGSGSGQASKDSGNSQASSGPGYGGIPVRREIGPGIKSEENGDGTVEGEPRIPWNNFLDSAILNPVVKVAEKYSYDQMVSDIQQLQARYGEKIHVNVIGQSHDGRDIYEVIVGNINAPKHILLQGAIHAREYMTPLLMMKQAETALFHYDTGQYDGMMLRDMLQQTALHFIPMSNPDGVALSQFGLDGLRSDFLKQTVLSCYARDTAEGRTALPIEQYLPLWKSNAMGVDLNHNFPADWDGIITSAAANSFAGYKGASPLSEPESQALASMADKYSWTTTVSYHSMGNIIYWDTQISKVKDASMSLAQRISGVTGYRMDESDGKGGYKDWMQSKDSPVPGITIEVGSVSCPLPVSQYDEVWKQNRAVWAEALKWSMGR